MHARLLAWCACVVVALSSAAITAAMAADVRAAPDVDIWWAPQARRRVVAFTRIGAGL
jgi:hypothetical protein